MANYKMRQVSYNALNNESAPPLGCLSEDSEEETPPPPDLEHEDASGVIIHVVPESNKGGWTHIEDLDSFFTRMYRYYLKGGFCPMTMSDCLQLLQYCFVIVFLTFLVFCVKYPVLFKDDEKNPKVIGGNVTLSDVIYDAPMCMQRITWKWWFVVVLCTIIWLVRLVITCYNLYRAYDIKLFYNHALKIKDSDIGWISWSSVQSRVREAQREQQMCIHKQQITELDIYHRILRFNNYFIAMVNKRLLPLHITVPFVGEIPYLSKGLKFNLEFLLFTSPWSPWENCWQLRECYKDNSKRLPLAKKLKTYITIMALLNFMLIPLILGWQILYFFFSYAELIKRTPGALGLRTWSLYSRISLRHFNELDHELSDRLNRAHKPATKYLASFPSPVTTVIAKNVAFVSGSILSVILLLTVYDEDVLTVGHMLTLLTACGVVLAAARSLISEEGIIGQRSSEELLVQVLGHVHYLPASWRGRAHTKSVATHFQQLFQFKAVYLVMELLSPIICPCILFFSLRSRAIDIVDFYRNFTVSVLGIGDVCSFAQMDVRRHGNPEWPASQRIDAPAHEQVSQYNQGEDGKTELSLVAFSCRNPAWRVPQPSQRHFLQALRSGVHNMANNYLSTAPLLHQNAMYKTMLGSYFHQSMFHGLGTPSCFPPGFSIYHQKSPERHLPSMEESANEDQLPEESHSVHTSHTSANAPVVPDKTESITGEEQEMSLSTLHLYDMHLAKVAKVGQRSMHGLAESAQRPSTSSGRPSGEDTPLLTKSHGNIP